MISFSRRLYHASLSRNFARARARASKMRDAQIERSAAQRGRVKRKRERKRGASDVSSLELPVS